MKKLSTSKRKNEIGFNLDIQPEHLAVINRGEMLHQSTYFFILQEAG